jgi:hypothetical protein
MTCASRSTRASHWAIRGSTRELSAWWASGGRRGPGDDLRPLGTGAGKGRWGGTPVGALSLPGGGADNASLAPFLPAFPHLKIVTESATSLN